MAEVAHATSASGLTPCSVPTCMETVPLALVTSMEAIPIALGALKGTHALLHAIEKAGLQKAAFRVR